MLLKCHVCIDENNKLHRSVNKNNDLTGGRKNDTHLLIYAISKLNHDAYYSVQLCAIFLIFPIYKFKNIAHS